MDDPLTSCTLKKGRVWVRGRPRSSFCVWNERNTSNSSLGGTVNKWKMLFWSFISLVNPVLAVFGATLKKKIQIKNRWHRVTDWMRHFFFSPQPNSVRLVPCQNVGTGRRQNLILEGFRRLLWSIWKNVLQKVTFNFYTNSLKKSLKIRFWYNKFS